MRVLVIGLAVTGEAVARHAVAAGDDVVVIEDAPSASEAYAARAAAVRDAGAQLIESPDLDTVTALVAGADLVVPSPGVPELHAALVSARERGTPVRSEVDLAGGVLRARGAAGPALVAVTGTNGKTTVTTVTAEILAASGRRVAAAGNIGRPLLDAVYDDVDVVVAEVSSFQLAFAGAFRPRAAALLNLGADHLDWHRTFDAYARSKARIFAGQGPDDLLVFNADDPVVAGLAAAAPGRRVPVSVTPGAASGYRVVETVDGPLLVGPDGGELVAVEAMALRAPHDLTNALTATALALEVGATVEAVRSVLTSFRGLAHRMQLVVERGGVRWVDDSKATNPHATITAVRGLEHVVLLAGGRNKGLDLSVLRALAPHLRAVVAIGDAGPDVADAFAGVVDVARASSMAEAVDLAAARAQPGDTVLLSPACASFDWYSSYAARGDDFAREARRVSEVSR